MVNSCSINAAFGNRDDKIYLFYSGCNAAHNPRFFVTETPRLEVPTMRGWIIYKDSQGLLKQETYEVERLLAAAKEEGIDLQVFSPDQFDLTITREDGKSILK